MLYLSPFYSIRGLGGFSNVSWATYVNLYVQNIGIPLPRFITGVVKDDNVENDDHYRELILFTEKKKIPFSILNRTLGYLCYFLAVIISFDDKTYGLLKYLWNFSLFFGSFNI